MKKTVQYFNKEAIDRTRGMTPKQIIQFLENYRILFQKKPEKCLQICLKIEPSLLREFKRKAKLEGIPYQTKIKELMKSWLN